MKKIYKSIFNLTGLTLALVGSASAQCDWTLDMQDDWGDGWNGNQVEISINGTATSYGLTGGSAGSEIITVNDDDVVAVTYLGGGSFNGEVSFTLTDNNANTVTSASFGPTVGQTYWQGVVLCSSSCAMPSDLLSDCTTDTEIPLTWQTNGTETSWEIQYGVSPTAFNGGSSVVLTTADVTINGSTVTYNLGGLTAGTNYDVYVAADCGGASYSSYPFESFTTATSCPDVTGITATVVDNDSVVFVWDAACIESNWNVEVGEAGFTPGNSEEFYANSINALTTDTVGGLTQITDYEIYVQSDCGGGSVGNWTGPIAFTSLPNCSAPTNFVAQVIAPDSVDLSWTAGSTGETEWTIEYGENGFTQGTGTFVSVTTNAYDTIAMLTQNTTYDFYLLGNCSLTDSSLWVGPETVTTPLFCNNVSGLSATTVTDTAFLSWTAGSNAETMWNVEYGPVGFELGTGTMYSTMNNNTDTLVGLMGSATYEYYVQAACASGDTSLFTGPNSFTMPLTNDDACDAIELAVDGQTLSFSSVGSTSQGEPINGGGGSSTWFYFVHPASNGVTASLCGSDFDTKIYGFEYGICGDFSTYTELNYNDDACGLQSEIELCGTPGDTIAVMVDGFGGSSGSFVITLSEINLNAGTDAMMDLCASDSAELFMVVTDTDSTGTWSFDLNPNAVVNGDIFNAASVPAGTHEVAYVVSAGCAADTATATLNVVTPGQSGTAVSPFTACNSDVFLPDGLTGVVEAGGSWSDDSGTGLLAGPNGNVFVANGLPVGTYPFTYTVSNGVCPDASTTVTVTLTNCTSVDENTLEFTVYPNPNEGTFNLISTISEVVVITVMDVQGKVVYNNKMNIAGGTPQVITLDNVETGMYILKVASESNVSTQSFIIK